MPSNKKEYQKEYNKKYYKEHQEKIKEQVKKYDEEHKEQNKEQRKKYNKTSQRKKSLRIYRWKYTGLICEDYDKLYEHYLNTNECDNCGIELVEGHYGANHKCMDHSHRTGLFRNILCHRCNIMRPHYESD